MTPLLIGHGSEVCPGSSAGPAVSPGLGPAPPRRLVLVAEAGVGEQCPASGALL